MNRPFERFTLHPESSNPIATDRITIAPLSLQEHAANKEESIEALAVRLLGEIEQHTTLCVDDYERNIFLQGVNAGYNAALEEHAAIPKEIKEFTEDGTPILGWFEYDFINKTEKFVTVEERKKALQEQANKEELSKEHAAYEEKATLKPSKLEYFQNARTEFCSVLNDQERSIRLMTACDSLLLAYDQMYAAIEMQVLLD